MKKTVRALAAVVCLLFLCSACRTVFADTTYNRVKEGENFGHNVDGYMKKLPSGFCMEVLLGEGAKLFFVPDDLRDADFFSEFLYNEPAILEGRFVKGFYDDEKLLLYEETDVGEYRFVAFDFASRVVSYPAESGLSDDKWFSLCNTMEQGL